MTSSTPETSTSFTLVFIARIGNPEGKHLRISNIEGTKDCYMELIDGKKLSIPSNPYDIGSLIDNIILKTRIPRFWTFFSEQDTETNTTMKEAYIRELRKVYDGHNRALRTSLEPYLKHFREFN